MGIRKILIEPDPILRQKSLEVKTVDKDLQNLMDDMLLTMYSAPGIGLAAIQVGVPKRVIVIDLSREKENKNPMFFINPKIRFVNQNGEQGTFFIKDPSGNVLEFKSFKDFDYIFTK